MVNGSNLVAPTPCAACPLRVASCFRPAPPALTEDLRLGQTRWRPGAQLVPSAAEADQLHTLFSGFAYRYRVLADGRRQVIDLLLPGDLIGPRTNPSTGLGIIAATEIVVCILRRDGFGRILAEGGQLALEFGETLFLEAERFERKLLLLGRQRPTERLAFLLLDLRDRLRSRGEAVDEDVRFPLSYRLMSDTLGLSRAQLARSLAELRDFGWVRREDEGFALEAEDQMASFCEYDQRLAMEPRSLI